MENALKITHKWCKTKGLVVNPLETSVMIFTRIYKPEPFEPQRPEGKEITFTNTVISRSLIRP